MVPIWFTFISMLFATPSSIPLCSILVLVTKSAVVDFQKLYGIAADGLVGTETKMKLAAALARL
ncbi:MAG: peptidoglycan-binding domain-containing protein [Acidobacteriota bacterium]